MPTLLADALFVVLVPLLAATLLLERCWWWRRFLGGHWELWWCDLVEKEVWYYREVCRHRGGRRPFGCHGRPTCEQYGRVADKCEADAILEREK